MGDVIAITDTAGTVVANYEYDTWGAVTVADTEIAQQNPLRYRGYYYDSETRYYYLQSRYYDPSICRFINADVPEITNITKDIPVGTNSFTYCNNNSTNNRDITGDIPLIASLIIGAIVGVILLYVVDIISNLINKRNMWKRVSSYSDYVFAAISGALSMVSIKKFSSLITASISSITYVCNCIESGKKFDFLSLVVIVLIDLAFGALAGKGVNLTNKVGIIKTSKNKLKTLVSPKKIAQYEKKIINAKKDIIKRSIRNAFAAITSKLQEKVRAYFGGKIKNKFLKRLALAGL
ncbi:MAG: RHS repeat domain-containing protein [Eubacterium sp.]